VTVVRRLTWTAAALATLAGCRGGSGGPKVTLRYRPPAGATYGFALEQQNSMKVEGGPMAQLPGQDVTLHIYYTQAVTGPTAGGIGVTVTYDSTTMEPGGMAPALDRMRGLRSNVVYDDRMRIVSASVSGVEGQPSPLLEQMGKSVKGITFALPEGAVGVGDSWTSESELPLGEALGASAPIKSSTKVTLKQILVEGADTSVLLAVETSFPGDPVTVNQKGRTATLRLSGAISGEQLFSVAKSVPVRSNTGGTMRIAVRAGEEASDAMTIAMAQQTSLRLTRDQ
jgi:hypothetical protein